MSETPSDPERVTGPPPSSIRILPSPDLVDRFAALTGDVSSLHVDDGFARRSAYRQRVVHGMLPLAFLPLLGPLRRPGHRCVPVSLSGRFVEPLFTGVPITLSADAVRAGDGPDDVAIDFSVRVAGAEAPATTGTIVGRFEKAGRSTPAASAEASMLGEPLTPRDWRFEDIEPGMVEDPIGFETGPGVFRAFTALLELGAQDVEVVSLEDTFDVGSLLTAMLLSTSVGVSLPGTPATFLDFSVDFAGPVPVSTPCALTSVVKRRSRATRIVKKEISVAAADTSRDEPLLTARVSTLVNEPAVRMPSMDELRASASDLGLAGKVVLVTGASRGIGETVAKLFAVHGARVVVNYHRGEADARRVVSEIEADGGEALAIGADVSDEDAVRSMVDEATRRFGTIDVLVNNAARDFRPVPFSKLEWPDVQADLDVVVKGALLCARAVIPAMVDGGGGRVINMGTVATETPPPDQLKYVVAKSALVGLTRALAAEFAASNVLVNMVVPNFVETDLVAHVPQGFRSRIADEIPLGRLAGPDEVAQAVVLLGSTWSRYTTGQKIMVTGGSAPLL